MVSVQDVKAWYDRDISRYAAWNNSVEVVAATENVGFDLKLRIYTEQNCFSIVARNPELKKFPKEGAVVTAVKLSVTELEAKIEAGTEFVYLRPDGLCEVTEAELRLDGGYLGCTAKSRKPRAGEDWHRGPDLSDGPLSEATWHRILFDIVSLELVRVHRHGYDVAQARAGSGIIGRGAGSPGAPRPIEVALQVPGT